MDEIDETNLSDQTKFRLNKISKIQVYFHEVIHQRKFMQEKI